MGNGGIMSEVKVKVEGHCICAMLSFLRRPSGAPRIDFGRTPLMNAGYLLRVVNEMSRILVLSQIEF